MFIDCSKLPDPLRPEVDDVFVTLDGSRTIVMVETPGQESLTTWISYYLDGVHHTMPRGQLPAMLTSAGARPYGRLDHSPRPQLTRDPELVKDRLVVFGPHHRALREQYGLSMGDLARALGCPPARLSMLELGEPDPVRDGAGVREDEGRAALAELLAETAARAYLRHTPMPEGERRVEYFRSAVWSDLAGILDTSPALAAMSTILSARGAAKLAADPGTSAWHRPARALTQATQRTGGGFTLYVYEPSTKDHPCSFQRGDEWWTWTNDEAFARAAAAVRWPGVNVGWADRGDGQTWALQTNDTTALLVADAPTRGELIIAVPPADESAVSSSVFRPGDHITYRGKTAVVREVDHEASAMLVTFKSGETSAVPMTEAMLANENVAIETARAGLGLCLARAVLLMQSGLSEAELEGSHEQLQIQATIESTLATDEAQRLIRLHG